MRYFAGALILLTGLVGCGPGTYRIKFDSHIKKHFAENVKTIVVQVWAKGKSEDYHSVSGRFRHNASIRPVYKYLKNLGYEVKVVQNKLDDYSARNRYCNMYADMILKNDSLIRKGQAFLEIYTHCESEVQTRTWTENEEIAALRDESGKKWGSLTQERARESSTTVYNVSGSLTLFYADRERPVLNKVVDIKTGGGYDWNGYIAALLCDIPKKVNLKSSDKATPEPPKRVPSQRCRCRELAVALNIELPGSTTETVHSAWWHRFEIRHRNAEHKDGILAQIDIHHDRDASRVAPDEVFEINEKLDVPDAQGWISILEHSNFGMVRMYKGQTWVKVSYNTIKGEETYKQEETLDKIARIVAEHIE